MAHHAHIASVPPGLLAAELGVEREHEESARGSAGAGKLET
jgi:hypothetical protein